MAETYSVKAVLSAVDKNLTSTMGKAASATEALGSGAKNSLNSIMKIAAGIGVFKALDTAIGAVTSRLDDAVDRFDTLNQFPKVMERMGFESGEVEKSIKKLGDGIDKLPTSLDKVVNTTKRIALTTRDLDKASSITLALNNAFVASGSGAEEAARGIEQYIQMLSTGKADQQSWLSLEQNMKYGLQEVAKQLGIADGDTQKLRDSLNSGAITFDEFNDALIECSERTDGFADVAADAAAGIKTSMMDIGTNITKGLANVMDAIDAKMKEFKLDGIVENLQKVRGGVDVVFGRIVSYINGLDMNGIKSLIGSISQLGAAFVAFQAGSGVLGATVAMDKFVDSLGGFGKLADGAKTKMIGFGKAAGGLGSKIANAKGINVLTNGLKKIGGGIGDAATKALFSFQAVTGRFSGGKLWSFLDVAAPKLAGFGNAFVSAFSIMGKVAISAFAPAAFIGGIAALFGVLHSQFGDQIDSLIDSVTQKGPEVINNFVDGILGALPNLISSGAAMMEGILNAITANLPALITGGISIVSGLVSGISQNLPTLIPAAVDMVLTLVSSLIDNVDTLIDAGISLLNGLADGINNSLPIIVTKGAEIIGKIASAIIRNLPKILQAGVQILSKLAQGVAQAVPQLIGKIPGIVSQAKSAFTNVNWGSVGMNIVRGIASGVTGAAGTLFNSLKSLASNALSAAKNALGIHSPSKKFGKFVGRFIPTGIAVYVTKYAHKAIDSVKKLSMDLLAAADMDWLNNSYSLSYAGDMSSNGKYYGSNATYTINVVSEMDGRKVGEGTATYTKAELERQEKLREMLGGAR